MVHRAVTRIGVALLLVSGMLFYVQGILIPYQEKDATSHNHPRGNLSDLYPRWLGARELLLHGRDPYSPETTREIQAGYYGRPLEAGRPGEPSDQQAFAYPVYVVFLLAPTVGLPFSVVQTAFFWFLLALTATSVALWLMLMNWRPARSTAAALTLLTLGSFAVIQGLKLQQLTLLVSGLIALSAALLSRGYLFLAGVLMAFVTIKPQLAIPIAGWFLIWALSNWKSRSRYVAGFGVTSVLFLAASQWLLPGWIARFRDGIVAYRSYTGGGGSVLDTLITPALGRPLAVLILLVIGFLCWRSRKASQLQPEFAWTTALVLTATVVVIPMMAVYNHVLLLPGILILTRQLPQLWRSSPVSRAIVLASAAIIAWPWVGATTLMVSSAFASPDQIQQWWALPLYSTLFIPLGVLALQLISSSKAEK